MTSGTGGGDHPYSWMFHFETVIEMDFFVSHLSHSDRELGVFW